MPIRFESEPLNLWSPLLRKLNEIPQAKALAEQWIGLIQNFEKYGVSETEIEWTNLVELLNTARGQKLSKEVVIREITKSPWCQLSLVRQVNDDFEPSLNFYRLPDPRKAPPVQIKRGTREQQFSVFRDPTFGLCVNLHLECDRGLFGRHRYWTLVLPQGKKKFGFFEGSKEFETSRQAMTYARNLLSRFRQRLANEGFVGTTKSENEFENYHLPGGDNYTEWLVTLPNFPASYWGPHFDYPNVVAHVRTTCRSNTEHQKVLLLEEIQSDWNQSLRDVELGKAKNYLMDNPPPDNPYRHQWLETALKAMLTLAARQAVSGIAWLPGKVHAQRFPWANEQGLAGFYDDVVRKAVAKLGKSWNLRLQVTRVFPHENNLGIVQTNDGMFSIYQRTPRELIDSKISTKTHAESIVAELEERTEEVPMLILTEACKADIRANGLPALGSIGNRVKP
jgi:hypothetical protein